MKREGKKRKRVEEILRYSKRRDVNVLSREDTDHGRQVRLTISSHDGASRTIACDMVPENEAEVVARLGVLHDGEVIEFRNTYRDWGRDGVFPDGIVGLPLKIINPLKWRWE